MNHVMLDLETMGNSASSAIISVGAVMFDPKKDGLGAEFYELVDLESSMAAGLKVDASTVMWWMQQSEEARAQFKAPGSSLASVLQKFSEWFAGNNGVYVWGNGASFDNVILSSAYRAVGIKQPWMFWNDRCYRTLKSENPAVKMQRVGTYHSAIDDAKSQALHLIDIFKAVRAEVSLLEGEG